jgi:hypothetical protein
MAWHVSYDASTLTVIHLLSSPMTSLTRIVVKKYTNFLLYHINLYWEERCLFMHHYHYSQSWYFYTISVGLNDLFKRFRRIPLRIFVTLLEHNQSVLYTGHYSALNLIYENLEKRRELIHRTSIHMSASKYLQIQCGRIICEFEIVKLSLCLTNWVLRYEGVWGSGYINPRFLDLGTSWRWVVNFTPWPLYPPAALPEGKEPPVPIG